jgi:hypothetical protein
MTTTTRIFGALLLALCIVASCIVGSTYAHHASIGVDRTKTVTVEGTVKEFKWGNPHAWLELQVTRDNKSELWNFEMLPPSYLIPAGWTRSTVKAGDKVKVTANGMIDGSPGGLFVSITLADGKTLGQRAGRGQ